MRLIVCELTLMGFDVIARLLEFPVIESSVIVQIDVNGRRWNVSCSHERAVADSRVTCAVTAVSAAMIAASVTSMIAATAGCTTAAVTASATSSALRATAGDQSLNKRKADRASKSRIKKR